MYRIKQWQQLNVPFDNLNVFGMFSSSLNSEMDARVRACDTSRTRFPSIPANNIQFITIVIPRFILFRKRASTNYNGNGVDRGEIKAEAK